MFGSCPRRVMTRYWPSSVTSAPKASRVVLRARRRASSASCGVPSCGNRPSGTRCAGEPPRRSSARGSGCSRSPGCRGSSHAAPVNFDPLDVVGQVLAGRDVAARASSIQSRARGRQPYATCLPSSVRDACERDRAVGRQRVGIDQHLRPAVEACRLVVHRLVLQAVVLAEEVPAAFLLRGASTARSSRARSAARDLARSGIVAR